MELSFFRELLWISITSIVFGWHCTRIMITIVSHGGTALHLVVVLWGRCTPRSWLQNVMYRGCKAGNRFYIIYSFCNSLGKTSFLAELTFLEGDSQMLWVKVKIILWWSKSLRAERKQFYCGVFWFVQGLTKHCSNKQCVIGRTTRVYHSLKGQLMTQTTFSSPSDRVGKKMHHAYSPITWRTTPSDRRVGVHWIRTWL